LALAIKSQEARSFCQRTGSKKLASDKKITRYTRLPEGHGAWADSVVTHTPAPPEASEEGIAVDGKTLRGSKKQGAPGTHL
jgi:hypothetical protein